MDISEKFIKMCKQAVKIQESWELKAGDCVACPPDRQDSKWTIEWYGENDADAWETSELKSEWDAVWLLRLDQSLGLIADKYCPHDTILYFLDFVSENAGCCNHESASTGKFITLEQLGLGWIMEEKYYKTWNHELEDWEKHDQ